MKKFLPLILISHIAIAHETVTCPNTIEVEEKLVTKTSFQLFRSDGAQTKKLPFSGVHIFDGHPKDMAQLKPDNGDDALPHFWSLKGKQFWMACSYGPEKKYLLILHLKPVRHECRMTKTQPDNQSYHRLNCR